MPAGTEFEVPAHQTLLQGALSAGIAFPNRCQIGACATCLCRLIEGDVRYHLEPMLTEQEKEQGWIFACQAIPSSDLVVSFEESDDY
ncbi:2Fe-2S iron-sulfur cluster binding domain-containing protein [Enterovibrio makurazakiensis]|uniref:2Fe-2S iron-sulfur cluster binding domain-containing protein n=1 Tax=Enterovibrio gelatinilyticus TaxID=2899819 RepID=A0ABT5QZM9_9GAMM|nr:2Fe-2S iron-sulfur cluster binding domain-containing protein [Enterovibrio sp. ZSDZ42]MDD1793475.1 2Fe-2S iron-sulfur cluster binding domain-containing protein [Enterovibrio sp. ZSDZ42]